MAYEQREGQGTLNTSKLHKEGDKKPTHYGDILLSEALLEQIRANGYVLPLSVWEKSGSYGVFYSVAADTYALNKEKQQRTCDTPTRLRSETEQMGAAHLK